MGDLKIQVQRLIDAGVPEQEIGAFIQKHSSETTASSQKSGGATGTWDEDQTWGNVLKESASNIPESAVNYGKNMIEPFRRPVETARGLGRLVSGLAGKLMPDEITLPNGEVIKTDTKNEFIVDALWKGIKNRYGSEENIKRTISKDPIGTLTDVATLAIPAGAALQGVGSASKLNALVKAGQTVSKAGVMLEPVTLGTGAIKKTLSTIIPKKLPSKLYQSAAKFSTTLTEHQRERLTQVALKNEILPNMKGLDELKDKISGINDQVTSIIDNIYESGQTIPVERLFKEFDSLRDDFLKYSGDPIKSVTAIEKVKSDILKANERIGRTSLTSKETQKLKQTIYKELNKQYNKITALPAKVEAQMAVARGAKEALEEIVPEIKQLNMKEGELIDLHNAIERVASRIGNRDVMGIGVPIKGGLGGIVGGYEGATAGLLLGVLDTPQVKARIARALSKLKRNGVKIKETPAMLRLLSVQVGRTTNNQ